MTDILTVEQLHRSYTQKSGWLRTRRIQALKPLSFNVHRGETLAVMGPSGSGKSTLAALLAGAVKPSGGFIRLQGRELQPGDYATRAQHIRLVFQDAENSMNPNLTLGEQLAEPLLFNTRLTHRQREKSIADMMQQVGLLREHSSFYPHMISTGQKHRFCIARAMILNPEVLILDEALSTLDSPVRAQIINLLLDLQQARKMTYIFISQSPELIWHLADRVMVLKQGEMQALGPVKDILNRQHR